MKAIYINIDPYLQAVAAWLKAGKPGTVPSFNTLPLAVTIPLGESAAIFLQGQSASDPTGPVQDWDDFDSNYITVDGYSMYARLGISSPGDILDGLSVPGFSALAPAAKYVVTPITDSIDVSVLMGGTGVDDPEITFTIPVLVRRETASGPVDLVDFTPPASGTPSAEQINAALGGSGATEGSPLAGVPMRGASFSNTNIVGAMLPANGKQGDPTELIEMSDKEGGFTEMNWVVGSFASL